MRRLSDANTETTMSPAELLADLQWVADWASETTPQGGEAVFDTARRARAAVAALIERESVLIAERDAYRAADQSMQDEVGRLHAEMHEVKAERDALAQVVAKYVAARDAYEVATRPGSSHGQPKRLAYSDPVLLRYREARASLDTNTAITEARNV